MNNTADVVIVGAGAAGLATAIFVSRRRPDWRILALDGAKRVGAKILISGGGRCNVTNRSVHPSDYFGGSSNVIRRVLDRFPVCETIDFFREIGVEIKEEPEFGKLFPRTDSARSVLAALLDECARRGVELCEECRIGAVTRNEHGFQVHADLRSIHARNVVLATGGQSFPKTGSDGGGYRLAQSLGHSIIPTTPSLAPLLLDGDFHRPLSGISMDVELSVRVEGEKPFRRRGPLLWTHFGVSGPEAMNISRVWHRARLDENSVSVTVNFLPDETLESVEKWLVEEAARRPRSGLAAAIAERIPTRVAEALVQFITPPPQALAHLSREHRRQAARLLTEFALPVRDSRGFAHAEATAGGVPLSEVDPNTLESRRCPDLFLAGEILDVDGRIGGFNFQWAWSSAFVAAAGLSADTKQSDPAVEFGR